MFTVFKDVDSPLFEQDYDHFFGTLHTFAYSFDDKSILTSIANSSQNVEIDFLK